jgi:hypothetical protein
MDDSQRFVAQHYRDFLSREPDASGLQFWTNEIERCGTDEACREDARVRTSTAFFRSVEFGDVGFLVYRFYKTAFGNSAGTPVPVCFQQFLHDTQEIGRGVIPGHAGWEQRLEANKQAFALAFVQRSEFHAAYPATMTPAEFVDKLSATSGLVLSTEERSQLIAELTAGAASRASVLRKVAENEDLKRQEFNRASVLSAYYGYLRRNPDDAPDNDFSGCDSRLAQLDGDAKNKEAEMIKSFLDSDEYRQRFGS